jgi:hypothetical protein
MGTINNAGYTAGYEILPCYQERISIMYHKASFDAGKLTRSIIIGLFQAVVSLGVAYVMYVGIWMLHYGK